MGADRGGTDSAAVVNEDFLPAERLLLALADKHRSWSVFEKALIAVRLEARTRGCICPAEVERLRVWWTDCPVHRHQHYDGGENAV